jgi:hypothetical protein
MHTKTTSEILGELLTAKVPATLDGSQATWIAHQYGVRAPQAWLSFTKPVRLGRLDVAYEIALALKD